MNKIPFQRDWFGEAVAIAEGRAGGNIKREHVVCLYEKFLAVCQRESVLQKTLDKILDEVKKDRIRKGLPVMPARPEGGTP